MAYEFGHLRPGGLKIEAEDREGGGVLRKRSLGVEKPQNEFSGCKYHVKYHI